MEEVKMQSIQTYLSVLSSFPKFLVEYQNSSHMYLNEFEPKFEILRPDLLFVNNFNGLEKD